jgi:hypothetical protein
MMVRLINFCADDGCGYSVFVCDRMAGIDDGQTRQLCLSFWQNG